MQSQSGAVGLERAAEKRQRRGARKVGAFSAYGFANAVGSGVPASSRRGRRKRAQ